ncbi:MAG: transcription termination/antitermination protein NusG [Clostridiales bacterium]|nr:transcription termination/antitermination protein NusG [Clostridiales bacterium]
MNIEQNLVGGEAKWFVVHTYSGYENKVKANIEKIVENRGMSDQIVEIVVPMQDSIEIKNGQRKKVARKVLPGYVLVKMLMNDDTWYIVRNTRGVTSFVGPGSKPIPLTEKEIASMGVDTAVIRKEDIDIAVGDNVSVVSGPFEGSVGVIKEINIGKRTVVIKLSFFGRETPVELGFAQIRQC